MLPTFYLLGPYCLRTACLLLMLLTYWVSTAYWLPTGYLPETKNQGATLRAATFLPEGPALNPEDPAFAEAGAMAREPPLVGRKRCGARIGETKPKTGQALENGRTKTCGPYPGGLKLTHTHMYRSGRREKNKIEGESTTKKVRKKGMGNKNNRARV